MAEIDWCARAAQLREIEMAMLAGEMVEEARFGADMTRWTKASLTDVQAALRIAERRCDRLSGKRTRYAISGRARPY